MTTKKIIIAVVVVVAIILAIVGIVSADKASREAMNSRIMGTASQINDYNATH